MTRYAYLQTCRRVLDLTFMLDIDRQQAFVYWLTQVASDDEIFTREPLAWAKRYLGLEE